ncbi:MAG: hypothetical protein J0H34_14465 [Rhizobiales bacterium]|nr:hypothetical protein [Hyphomicrobiales bacterium]
MIHHASPDFWEAYDRLPEHIRSLADRNFSRLKENPAHPSLQFKPVGRFWSVRVGLHCRALAVRDRDDLIWFWIGSHAEYDQLIG